MMLIERRVNHLLFMGNQVYHRMILQNFQTHLMVLPLQIVIIIAAIMITIPRTKPLKFGTQKKSYPFKSVFELK